MIQKDRCSKQQLREKTSELQHGKVNISYFKDIIDLEAFLS